MIIDLDVPTAGPRPARHPGRLWKPLLAAAPLLLLGGAATPAGPDGLQPVADTGGRATWSIVLTEDALYAAHAVDDARSQVGARSDADTAPSEAGPAPSDAEDGRSEVRARPLHPGGPDWTARVAGWDPLLTRTATTVIADAGFARGLTVLDARTGRELLRAEPGTVAVPVGERLASWRSADGDGRGELWMRDLTGRTLWSRRAEVSTLHGAAGHLVAVGHDFRGTVFDAATGRVLAEDRDLGINPQLWGLDSPEAFTAIAVHGDRLYVYGPSDVAAFRAGDLSPLWRTPLDTPLDLTGCGAALCVREANALTVLDPATGRVRWSGQRFRTLTAGGIATDVSGFFAEVDPATGRVLRERGRGGVAGDFVLRTDRDRTVVIGPDGAVAGVLPPVAPARCRAAGPHLACETTGHVATVWRVSRPPPRVR